MADDSDFYTATMAKVYVEQGYLEKATEIYRHLLEHEPDRQDLIEALSEIEKKVFEKKKKNKKMLVVLFDKWIDLLLKYNKLQKLKKFQNKLQKKQAAKKS